MVIFYEFVVLRSLHVYTDTSPFLVTIQFFIYLIIIRKISRSVFKKWSLSWWEY